MLSKRKLKRVNCLLLMDTVKFGIGLRLVKLLKGGKLEMGSGHSLKSLDF